MRVTVIVLAAGCSVEPPGTEEDQAGYVDHDAEEVVPVTSGVWVGECACRDYLDYNAYLSLQEQRGRSKMAPANASGSFAGTS